MKTTTSYDPEVPPDPTAWNAMPEQARIRAVSHFHMVTRLKSGSQKAHAAFHVAVENQAATGFGPTVRALDRLQRQGLTRHDAIHAVASVIAESVWESTQSTQPPDSQTIQSELNAAIERLDARSWLQTHAKQVLK